MENLSLDPINKSNDTSEVSKKVASQDMLSIPLMLHPLIINLIGAVLIFFLLILQPSGVQYGSANVGEAPIAPIPSKQSVTPILQEHIDASTCFVPNGYSSPFYYGG